jgi:hypothetical protein
MAGKLMFQLGKGSCSSTRSANADREFKPFLMSVTPAASQTFV